MHSIPLELPVKTSEAARLAGLIFEQIEGRRLNEDLRKRFIARMHELQLVSVVPLGGSLQRDPIHPSTYYLAADTREPQPRHWLLRIASAASPSSGLFPQAVLIGRMRTDKGPEVVVNAISFERTDRENIRKFAERVDPDFLPKPRGSSPAICVERNAFETYREILRSTGVNLASRLVRDEIEVDAAVWAAIRAGWREGYGIETEMDSTSSILRGCTGFTVQAREPLEDLLEIHHAIRSSSGRKFDFEVSFAAAPAITAPEEIAACLGPLKRHGISAQFVNPRYETVEQLTSLLPILRQFGAVLSIHSTGLPSPDILREIGKATSGRVKYKIYNSDAEAAETNRMILLAAEHLRA